MQVHYLNHKRFQEGDTKLATEYAAKLIKEDPALKIVTYLVFTQTQYEPFLGEMGFSAKDYKNHGYSFSDGKLQIHTIKTYDPSYLFVGQKPSEILIAVGLPPEGLLKYEDKSNIAHCIIVPWILDENREFLSIHEAKDIQTGEKYPKPADPDERILNAIGWLKNTSYPNEGYHHPNDSERLHKMANAIKKNHVPVDYASIVYCGIHNGLIPSAARKTADAFIRAQTRLFAVERDTNYALMKQIMSQPPKDINSLTLFDNHL